MTENQSENCNKFSKIVFAPLTWFILFCVINLCTTWFFTHKVTSVYEKYAQEYSTVLEHIKTPAKPAPASKIKGAKPAPKVALAPEKKDTSQEDFERSLYQIQSDWLNLWMIVLAVALGVLGVAFPIMFAEQMKNYQESSENIRAKTKETLKEIDEAQKSLKDLREAQSALIEIRRADLPQVKENLAKIKQYHDESEANALFSQGYYEESLASFERVLEAHPTNEIAFFNYGIALEKLKRPKEALLAYEKAIEINRDFAMAHNKKGDVLQALGKDEEALIAYDVAISCKPDFATAYFNRGTVLGNLGDYESSTAAAQKNYEDAAKSLKKAIALNPNYAEAHCNYGIALAKFNRHEEAISAYNRAIELEPNDAISRYNLGFSLEQLKKYEEAISAYNRAIFLKPNYTNAHYSRGGVLEKLGHYKEALASVEKALKYEPENKAGIKARERLLGILNSPHDYED